MVFGALSPSPDSKNANFQFDISPLLNLIMVGGRARRARPRPTEGRCEGRERGREVKILPEIAETIYFKMVSSDKGYLEK